MVTVDFEGTFDIVSDVTISILLQMVMVGVIRKTLRVRLVLILAMLMTDNCQ